MRELPRQLSVEELAELFGGRTPLRRASGARSRARSRRRRTLLAESPEEEQIEALNAHPPIGARRLTGHSAVEQGTEDDPAILTTLAYLNEVYVEKFGFRFLVFVNRRPKAEIVPVLEERLARTREEELETALDELVAIARDRWESGPTA